jgi:hypothetical protein
VRRLLLLASLSAALIAAACGGSTVVPPPPPTGNFSTGSLRGQYTFSMAGEDLNGGSIARVGSFIADGAGKIRSALEDVNDEGAAAQTVSFDGGNYSVDPNGHGTLTFLQGTTIGLQFSIVLSSTSQGQLIQTDLNATSSGNFTLASATTPATFNLSLINGNYVFDVAGIRTVQAVPLTDVGLSILGQLKTNGSSVSGGLLDVNDGASGTSGPVPILSGTSYQLDPSNGNGTNFGRGTISFVAGTRTFNFVFYIVDATRFKLLEVDQGLLTSGDAILQGTVPTQSSGFTGSFVTLLGGSDSNGPLAEVGRFTADGSQNLNNVSFDVNEAGTLSSTITNPASPVYQIDAVNAGSGRGTMSFSTTVLNLGQINFVFYVISPTQGFIQDTSTSVVADGSFEAQSGAPFTASSVAGNYAVGWSGVNLGSSNNIVFEHDFLGQYVVPVPSGQQHNGAIDIVELGSSGKNFIPQDPVTLTLNIAGDGTASNPNYDFLSANAPTANLKFKAYFVSQQKVYLLGNQPSTVDLGVATQQH